MIDSKLSLLSLSDPTKLQKEFAAELTKLQKEFEAELEAAKAAEATGKGLACVINSRPAPPYIQAPALHCLIIITTHRQSLLIIAT